MTTLRPGNHTCQKSGVARTARRGESASFPWPSSPPCRNLWRCRNSARYHLVRCSGAPLFPIDISLSSCACSGGERNSPSLISPCWRKPSTEFPWAYGPSHDMKITSSPPRKRGSTSRGRGWIRFRGNDAYGRIFRRARALHPFYLTAWVFLPDPSADGNCICAPVYPVTISLATK
jgi:hypothetical protein